MRRWLVVWLICGLVAPAFASGRLTDLQRLIYDIETQYIGKTTHAIATLKVVTAHYTREMKLEIWGEGRDKMLAKVIAPQKDYGVATLKIGDDVWNYLPRIDRLMKIPSSMMGEGWMGSHWTNDDLVQEAKVDELYDFELIYEGETTATIRAVPRPDAAVVWGRIDYELRIAGPLPLRARYYDEDGELVRILEFEDVRTVAGREIPMRIVVLPQDKPDERTEFIYESIEFDVPLPENLFSLTALRRR